MAWYRRYFDVHGKVSWELKRGILTALIPYVHSLVHHGRRFSQTLESTQAHD